MLYIIKKLEANFYGVFAEWNHDKLYAFRKRYFDNLWDLECISKNTNK